jgi:N utilization substance protein B
MSKSNEEKQSIKARRRARKLALQALYQWQMSAEEPSIIEAQFHVINDMEKINVAYFHRLLHDIPAQLAALQTAFSPFLDRPIEQLNPIELTILRISTFELIHCLDLPSLIILDEAVSLAKEFGSQDGFRYVNGVLNHLARQQRPFEFNE